MAIVSKVTVIESPLGGQIMFKSPDVTSSLSMLLDARISAMEDFSGPLQEFGEFIVDRHIPYQIARQGTPERYPILSFDYAAWKETVAPGQPILMLSGDMVRGFAPEVSENDLEITDATGYARYHHTGTRKMPQRKFIQLEDDIMGWKKWNEIVKDHLLKFERL